MHGNGRLCSGLHAKLKQSQEKKESIWLRCGAAVTPAEVNKLKATKLKLGQQQQQQQRANLPVTLQL